MFSFACVRLIYPIADGYHSKLPQPQAKIVVWGEHSAAVGTATTWLQKQGLTVLERARLQQLFAEQQIQLSHMPDDAAQVLRVGKLAGADTVIFVETSITSGVSGRGFC